MTTDDRNRIEPEFLILDAERDSMQHEELAEHFIAQIFTGDSWNAHYMANWYAGKVNSCQTQIVEYKNRMEAEMKKRNKKPNQLLGFFRNVSQYSRRFFISRSNPRSIGV